MYEFDHRAILANQMPDIVGTMTKGYDIGRKRAIENQAIERKNRLNESINSWDKSKPLSQHLIESGFADEGYDYAKKDAEVKKTQADATKSDYENRLKMIDIAGRATQELLAHPALSKDAVKQKADEYFQAGLTTPEMYQKQINMLPSLPDDPVQLRKHIESQVMGLMEAKEQMKYQRPDANAQLNAQTQMRNQDLDYSLGQQNYSLNSRKADFDNQMNMSRFNLDKQDKEFKQGLDSDKLNFEKQKNRSGGNISEDERKAAGWLAQADNAYKNMLSVLSENPDADSPSALEAILPESIKGAVQSPGRQKYTQAASSFSEAAIRAATGAGVNKDEAAQKIKELTPGYFDDIELKKQKADSLRVYLNSLKIRANRAAPEGYQVPGGGASDGWDDGHVTMQAQKLGTDPAKVKAFLQWKASQGR